jgi:hypothetical protein
VRLLSSASNEFFALAVKQAAGISPIHAFYTRIVHVGRDMRSDRVTMDPVWTRVSGTAAWLGSRAPTAIFLMGCLAAVFLVLWPDYLPMVDAPNHLARLTIIAAPEDSALRRMYSVSWTPIPNLGLDLVFLALKDVASPALVMRLCVLTAVLAILTSAYVIQIAAFGRASWSVAFVPIFVFGSAWHVGLINYMMGVGVALAGLALFIRTKRRLDPWRGVLLAVIGLVAIICHIAAFAAFMLLLSALYCAEELAAPGRAAAAVLVRKCGRLTLVFLPGILFYKPVHTAGLYYAPLDKLEMPLFATFGTGTYADVAVLGLAVAIYLLLGLCGGIGVWRPGRPALILMTMAVMLIPSRIDNAMLIDSRLMLILAVSAVSMTEIRSPLRNLGPVAAMALVTVLIGFRGQTILAAENTNDRDVAEFRAAMKSVEGHPRILLATDTYTLADCTASSVDQGGDRLHADIGSYLTIDRQAYTQLIFAGRGMQPIRARGDYAPISSPASLPVPVHILQLADDPAQASGIDAMLKEALVDRYVLDWRRDFDDMLVLHSGCARNPFPGELTTVIDGGFFTLYRIDRSHAS